MKLPSFSSTELHYTKKAEKLWVAKNKIQQSHIIVLLFADAYTGKYLRQSFSSV